MRAFGWILIAAWLVIGCKPPVEEAVLVDADGDTYGTEFDCDDGDPNRNPAAPEVCNGVDDNCDGAIDEGVLQNYFTDADLDGYGDSGKPIQACEVGAGVANNALDCDDARPDVNPYAPEVCDGVDNDCDNPTKVDEGVLTTFYADTDGDGHGDPKAKVDACELADGISADKDDCDDTKASVFKGAPETCNDVDDDCNGTKDDNYAVDAVLFWADLDNDTYGDPYVSSYACERPEGYVNNDEDCNDASAKALPGGTEKCDALDNDCDGTVDEDDATDAKTWYADDDGDLYGDATDTSKACEIPTGYVAKSGDCDDTAKAINPKATEVCNDTDDDCDGTADDNPSDGSEYYLDDDSDGYGDAGSSVRSCDAVSGYVTNDDDCDDGDGDVSPIGVETCNSTDDDCNGTVDDSYATDATTYYYDGDGDTYGDSAKTKDACTKPTGYVTNDDDCNDASKTVKPGASETCNDVDDDCDGTVDETPSSGGTTYYYDGDGDGYGTATTSAVYCAGDQPSTYVSNSKDCDDSDKTLSPDTKWYYDGDLDSYGRSTASYTQCADPGTYYVRDNTDCDDATAKTYPGATEICLSGTSAEGKDNDCDSTIDEACPTIHCGTISKDETWSFDTDGHYVSCDVYVQDTAGGSPTLTIEDGTEVEFASTAGLYVGYSYGGDIVIEGTSSGVSFTSAASTPGKGDYDGLYLGSGATGSVVEGLSIQYAGYGSTTSAAITVSYADVVISNSTLSNNKNNGIYIYYATPLITDTTIQDNSGSGIYCGSSATLACLDPTADSFIGNVITDNDGYPIRIRPEDVGAISEDNDLSGNTNDFVWLVGATVSSSQTWHALDVPYFVDDTIYVDGTSVSATLTLDDGVKLYFDANVGLYVGYYYSYYYDGDIEVLGGTKGVLMSSKKAAPGSSTTPAKGDWYGLQIWNGSTSTTLTGLTIEYAGGNASYPGGLFLYNATGVVVTDSTFKNNKGSGAVLDYSASAQFADSSFVSNAAYGLWVKDTYNASLDDLFAGNTVTGNAAPVSIDVRSLGMLDPTSTYTGNTKNEIEVTYYTNVINDATWKLLDVPYNITEGVYIGTTGSGATVTIEDDVELLFSKSAFLAAGYSNYGDLIIEGDTSDGTPVVLTSAEGTPKAGDWYGLFFGSYSSSTSSLVGFELAYAGGGTSVSYYPTGASGITTYYAALTLDDCDIHDNRRYGVWAYYSSLSLTNCSVTKTTTTSGSTRPDGTGVRIEGSTASIDAWANNEITGNARYPVELPHHTMGALSESVTSSTYAGNYSGYDYIYASYANYISTDQTWAALDVPWYVDGNVLIAGSASPVVDVEDDQTVYMGRGAYIYVGYYNDGDLTANDVVFTSIRAATGTPSKGDWEGLRIGSYASGSTAVSSSTIAYAGSITSSTYSTSDGAIYVDYGGEGSFTGNTISNSQSCGIYDGSATSGSLLTVSSNTYTSNATGSGADSPAAVCR